MNNLLTEDPNSNAFPRSGIKGGFGMQLKYFSKCLTRKYQCANHNPNADIITNKKYTSIVIIAASLVLLR